MRIESLNISLSHFSHLPFFTPSFFATKYLFYKFENAKQQEQETCIVHKGVQKKHQKRGNMHANNVGNYFLQFSFLDIRQIANIKNQSSEIDSKAPEGPFLILFQRDLFAANQEIAPKITCNVMEYYVQHASQWLSWKDAVLSVYAEVPLCTVEATKISTSLPQAVDVVFLLQNRSDRLKHFFNQKSKETPYIALSNLNSTSWKSITTVQLKESENRKIL